MGSRLWTTAVLLSVFVAAPAVHAAYMYPWSSTPRFSDALGDSAPPSTDLVDVWWARDGVYDYWRFDLPVAAEATPNYFYGAYLDLTAGLFFSPPVLPFADAIVGVEWANGGSGYGWTPFITNGVYTYFSGGMVQGQVTENGTQSVEFRIDTTQGIFPFAPRDYHWAGVSGVAVDPAFLDGHTDLDYAAARDTVADTPEPATLVLLPLGGALLLRRLKRSKTSQA